MEDGTTDTMRVRFPASPEYLRVGRVAMAGLALRLGVDIGRVENLRLAVDSAAEALSGPGEITIEADWEPGRLTITVANAARQLTDPGDLAARLNDLVDEAAFETSQISLKLTSAE